MARLHSYGFTHFSGLHAEQEQRDQWRPQQNLHSESRRPNSCIGRWTDSVRPYGSDWDAATAAPTIIINNNRIFKKEHNFFYGNKVPAKFSWQRSHKKNSMKKKRCLEFRSENVAHDGCRLPSAICTFLSVSCIFRRDARASMHLVQCSRLNAFSALATKWEFCWISRV